MGSRVAYAHVTIVILAGIVHDYSGIDTFHPGAFRPVPVSTGVGAPMWQRAEVCEIAGKVELLVIPSSVPLWSGLEHESLHVGAVYCEGERSEITLSPDRGVQDLNCLEVVTLSHYLTEVEALIIYFSNYVA